MGVCLFHNLICFLILRYHLKLKGFWTRLAKREEIARIWKTAPIFQCLFVKEALLLFTLITVNPEKAIGYI
jgi:hypothetical protein